jgi:hypothetical protein
VCASFNLRRIWSFWPSRTMCRTQELQALDLVRACSASSNAHAGSYRATSKPQRAPGASGTQLHQNPAAAARAVAMTAGVMEAA